VSGFPRLCLKTAYRACLAISLPLFKLDMQISRIQLSSPVLAIKFLRAVPVRVCEDALTVCCLQGYARVAGCVAEGAVLTDFPGAS
jgi:hypothetical protein